MPQSLFYVSHNGQSKGPFAVPVIIEKLKSREFSATDYIYDEEKQDWVLILEWPELQAKAPEFLAAPPPIAKPVAVASPDDGAVEQEWFVLRGENRFGPFTYVDVIQMLQSTAMYEYDYIWHKDLPSWKRVAELPDFSPEKIRAMVKSHGKSNSEIFFRRRHVRAKYGGSLIVHDNKQLWKGKSIEVSVGGAGIVMDQGNLEPGQTLYVHFKPGDGVPPFNAVCEIVSKQFADASKDANVRYGVKFTSLTPAAQQNIRDLTTKTASANKAAA
ncbi:MAG: GYF domain-containing protein [Pseudobdellovibrionaceae bacterium]